MPLDFKISESLTSCKLSWRPPPLLGDTTFTLKSFLITYVDHAKSFKAPNGTFSNLPHGRVIAIKVPARDDPTMEIFWLVSSLQPNTFYDFKISALILITDGSINNNNENSLNLQQGPSIKRTIKTGRDRPAHVDRPIIEEILSDNTVLIRTGNASEQNGPIKKYWLIVQPIAISSINSEIRNSYENVNNEQNHLKNYEMREKDIKELLQYSIYDEGGVGDQAKIQKTVANG